MIPKPYAHQLHGIEQLLKWDDPNSGRVFGGCFLLADEMGLGKSRQIIETAMQLHRVGELNNVIVVCPASVRSVWYDEELGELTKFHTDSMHVVEYHSRMRFWLRKTKGELPLTWYITNYDFIRAHDSRTRQFTNLAPLLKSLEGQKNWVVLDESSAIKNHKSLQYKACRRLRSSCERVTLLNGTPISHSPADLYAQAEMMHPGILNCKTWIQFRGRYGVMGGFKGKQIVNWQNLDDLTKRLSPYVLRRESRDCLDLPPRLPPITLVATLKPETWKTYKELRDELITWLDSDTTASAAQAGVRALRLAQVCSGFLSGLRQETACACNFNPECVTCGGDGVTVDTPPPKRIGDEKQSVLLKFLERRMIDEGEKVLTWCRFRWEVEHLLKAVNDKWPAVPNAPLWGGQKREERGKALRLLDPRTSPEGAGIVVGTPATGSMGLNLTAASTMVYVSNDYSLKTRLQSEKRIDRPGQLSPMTFVDIIAEGPKGQKTIDHAIVKSLRDKNDLATWTTAQWKEAILSE
jgi:SNF2 family DNA or RNA helicase